MDRSLDKRAFTSPTSFIRLITCPTDYCKTTTMADEEMADIDTPRSDSDDSDESEEAEVELLVAGRERRKTAGNRYNRDAVQEEGAEEAAADEDEVALLFADNQDEVDEEFKSEASDGDDMSSSDDDDQGPAAGADDLEGEKELEKQAKEARAKKRKAEQALTSTAALRKRPKIDPTAPKTAPKKPSKKKERVTWVPEVNNANARASLRKGTIAHRETTIARLKQNEAQSKKYKALKEKRDREKAKNAPKAMTQADRLAEAERTERRNAKSLNRWEAMEKKRTEEQAAKLAALKNRKLGGAVISWHSGKAKFRGPKHLPDVPQTDFMMDDGPRKRGRKTKAYHEQMANMREAATHNNVVGFVPMMPPPVPGSPIQQSQQPVRLQPQPYAGYTSMRPVQQTPPVPVAIPAPSQLAHTQPLLPQTQSLSVSPTQTAAPGPQTPPSTDNPNNSLPQDAPCSTPAQPVSFLDGIHDYAKLETENQAKVEGSPLTPTGSSSAPNKVDSISAAAAPPPVSDVSEPSKVVALPPSQPADLPATGHTNVADAPKNKSTSLVHPLDAMAQQKPLALPTSQPPHIVAISTQTSMPLNEQSLLTTPTPQSPEVPIEEGFMTKNLVILKDFDDLSTDQRHELGVFFNTRKTAKPTKHGLTICPITLMPAKYRDPATGIGYANMYAYKVLQELKAHKFAWSSMLGCYIGRDGAPIARGCPEGFLSKVAQPVPIS